MDRKQIIEKYESEGLVVYKERQADEYVVRASGWRYFESETTKQASEVFNIVEFNEPLDDERRPYFSLILTPKK